MKNKTFISSFFARACLIVLLLSIFYTSAYSQNIRVTGRVIDENGELMIGVSIIEKDAVPINGTVTDYEGNYALNVS